MVLFRWFDHRWGEDTWRFPWPSRWGITYTFHIGEAGVFHKSASKRVKFGMVLLMVQKSCNLICRFIPWSTTGFGTIPGGGSPDFWTINSINGGSPGTTGVSWPPPMTPQWLPLWNCHLAVSIYSPWNWLSTKKMNDWNTFFRFHVSFRECTFINSEVYTNSWGTLVNQQVWKLGSAGGFKATWRERTTRWGEATDILVHQSVGNSQNEDIC